jgi:hypothetical protein
MEIDVRRGVSGRLTAEDQVNVLANRKTLSPPVGLFGAAVPAYGKDEAICGSPAQAGVVGAGAV